MTSPITNATAYFQMPPTQPLSPRQRLENALEHLPPIASGGTTENEAGIDREALIEPIERINEVMRPFGVEFEQPEEATRIITRIVDRDSGEVIRQITAEEVLRIADRLGELQGRLIRQQV